MVAVQLYFHRKSGQERVAPPPTKGKEGDHQRHTAHGRPHGHVLHTAAPGNHGVLYHPAYHTAMHPAHAVDAAAAMAVAALRGRCAASAHTETVPFAFRVTTYHVT